MNGNGGRRHQSSYVRPRVAERLDVDGLNLGIALYGEAIQDGSGAPARIDRSFITRSQRFDDTRELLLAPAFGALAGVWQRPGIDRVSRNPLAAKIYVTACWLASRGFRNSPRFDGDTLAPHEWARLLGIAKAPTVAKPGRRTAAANDRIGDAVQRLAKVRLVELVSDRRTEFALLAEDGSGSAWAPSPDYNLRSITLPDALWLSGWIQVLSLPELRLLLTLRADVAVSSLNSDGSVTDVAVKVPPAVRESRYGYNAKDNSGIYTKGHSGLVASRLITVHPDQKEMYENGLVPLLDRPASPGARLLPAEAFTFILDDRELEAEAKPRSNPKITKRARRKV